MRTATGESEPDVTKIRELEERLDNFRIQVSNDLTIRGNAWQGYALNAYTCDELGRGGGPPTPTTGACCLPDGTCEEVTVAQCIEDGGTFVGGLCADADCPQPTGACCVGSDCSIETESDCTDMGGTYQGDDTTCDPNPCEIPPCGGCGFTAFDGSGRIFLTKTWSMNWSEDNTDINNCVVTITANKTESYDEFCNYTCSCSGSINRTAPFSCTTTPGPCIGGGVSPGVSSGPWASSDAIGCDFALCQSCVGILANAGIVTATSASFSLAASTMGTSGSGTITITLSNECIP